MVKDKVDKSKRRLKVRFCDKMLWGSFLAVLGVVSSLISLVSFFGTPADIEINMLYIIVPFVLGIIILFLAMWIGANCKSCAELKINNTTVRVVQGDIWEQMKKEPKDRTKEINVIGVNDFYDVVVDNRIIASSSLHGQYIKRIIDAGKLEELNRTIENDAFLNKYGNYKTVLSRKVGKKIRYELGSVVEFESYIMAAFTKFDNNNEAWLSAEEYTRFWMRFWENISKIYAGRTINIPLMGAGITRFKNGKPSKQELLEVMLWTLKISGFCNTYPDRHINFIIYPGDAIEIDFYHIQHNPNYK